MPMITTATVPIPAQWKGMINDDKGCLQIKKIDQPQKKKEHFARRYKSIDRQIRSRSKLTIFKIRESP